MRKSNLYPTLALGMGLVSALLRLWQRAAGYDADGLPRRFSAPAVVLTLFLCLSAGAFLYLALRQPKKLEEQKPALPRDRMSAGLYTAAGVLILAGGAVNLLSFLRSYLSYSQILYASQYEQQAALRRFLATDLVTGVVALAAVPTAAALLTRAKELKAEAAEATVRPFAALMPPVFCWLWLIKDFRQHTSNPVLWDYALLLLAIIVLLVSTYERAGFAFGVGKPRRTVFTSLAALLLAVAALPDCYGLANACTLIALACVAWTELAALMLALEQAPVEADAPNAKEDVSHE